MARRMSAKKKEEQAPPPEMTAEALNSWNGKIERAVDAQSSAAGTVQNTWKQAKDGGVDTDALRVVRKLAKLDPPIAQQRLKNIVRYADMIGLNDQADMFDQDGDNATTTPDGIASPVKAYHMGHEAGRKGKNPDDNPFDADAPRSAWQQGWQDAQEENAREAFGGKEQMPEIPEGMRRTGTSGADAPAAA